MEVLDDNIINIISKHLCVYDYFNIIINEYYLINKIFNKHITYNLSKLNYTNETLYLATKTKHWDPKMDQISYIYDSFIIFDDLTKYNIWNNITKCNKTYKNYEDKIIIKCELYKFLTFNYDIYNDVIDNEYITNIYSSVIDNITINKLKFDIYFIYYFIEDLYYCYGINFLILPYYDDRIVGLSNFHKYKIIKKNNIYNHNIVNINTIEF